MYCSQRDESLKLSLSDMDLGDRNIVEMIAKVIEEGMWLNLKYSMFQILTKYIYIFKEYSLSVYMLSFRFGE